MKTQFLLMAIVGLPLAGAHALGSEILGVGQVSAYVSSCDEDSSDMMEETRLRADHDADRKCRGMAAVRKSEYFESENCRFVRWDVDAPYLKRVTSHAIYHCSVRPLNGSLDELGDEDKEYERCMNECMRKGKSEGQCMASCGGW